jgi:PmbA protein
MLDLEKVVGHAMSVAKTAGAEETKSAASWSSHMEMEQRNGVVEKTSQATSQGLVISLLVDGRYSGHSTSDLRSAAIEAFVKRAVDATRILEPDEDRRQISLDKMGANPIGDLDLFDKGEDVTGAQLREKISDFESEVQARKSPDLVSASAHIWTTKSHGYTAFSNGFSGSSQSTSFGLGGEVALLEESGKRPEASAFFSARHKSDQPTRSLIADTLWERAGEVTNSSAGPSGKFPMFLSNRVAGKVVGSLLGAMSGRAIWQGRSMLADKLGEQVGSAGFTVRDEPTIPRGIGSRSFDGDGLRPQSRYLFEEGRLSTYLLDVYHARKLKMEPTGAGVGNLVVAPGDTSWQEMASSMPTSIRVTSFLGGNSNSTTGDFSFGIRGQLLEHGEVVQNLSEMNISGNLLELIKRYQAAGNDPWLWSSYRLPTLLFDGVQFSGA